MGDIMSTKFTVVARTTGGWRSPPTIQAMTLDEARERCQDLCNRFPNQEFDILGVVAQSKRTNSVSLEAVDPASLDIKRFKEIAVEAHGHSANVTALRGNA
jgi:hypothetical protein